MDHVSERARQELEIAQAQATKTGLPMSTLEKAAFLQGYTLGYVGRMEDQEIALRREIDDMQRRVECPECDPGSVAEINHGDERCN